MTTFLVDTSAWIVAPRDAAARRLLADLAPRYLAATTEPVMFELLTTARDSREMRDRRLQLAALDVMSVDARDWERAFDVYELLAARGPLHHRQVARTDLLVAAVAERNRVPVLHYDHDFDLIAEVTGQPVRWIAPRGSLTTS